MVTLVIIVISNFSGNFSGIYKKLNMILVTGRYDLTESESRFFDRDGTIFGHVLAYLRDGVVAMGYERDVNMLGRLKREFDYYRIELFEEHALILVVGGTNGRDDFKSTTVYDPSTDSWTESRPMLEARTDAGIYVLDGDVYVSGGFLSSGNVTSSVERYSLWNNTWSLVAAMPTAICGHGVCSINGSIYVIGGCDGSIGENNTDYFRQVLKYDTVSWSDMAPMPAVCAVDNAIYVIGGTDDDDETCMDVYKYVVDTNVWSTVASMPSARANHRACAFKGLIYVVGGTDNMDLNNMLQYDTSSNTWSEMAPMLQDRSNFSMSIVDSCIYVIGGDFGNEEIIASTEKYEIEWDRWSFVRSIPIPRRRSQACVLPIRNVFDAMMRRAMQ